MKIYYFSGTGNSLAVVRKLKKYVSDEGDIYSITEFINEKTVEVDTDILGFVFPVYFMNVQEVLKEFINKLEFKTKPYIFAIATCNGIVGRSLFSVNKLLIDKGQVLSSGFAIEMPGNAIVTPPEVEIKRLNSYEMEVAKVSTIINNRELNEFDGKDDLKTCAISYLLKSFGKKLFLDPKNISITSECSGCGTCVRVCPLNNIKIINKRPEWGNNCSTCLACFHWCPKRAIRSGRMLNKRRKYHNPEVCIKDMDLKNKVL